MQIYERKTPQDLDCGITVFTKVLGAKWKPCILDAISKGFRRPSEMHRWIPEATKRVIDMQLSELETFGMVSKQVYEGFPLRVEYALTPMGESVLPVIAAMDRWGNAHKDHVKTIDEQITSRNVAIMKAGTPNIFSVTE